MHSCFCYSVRIKRIAIAKCGLFFHYHYVKELFYYFRDTKHEKTREFHLYCWDHVCKVNEWCLVDCLHREFRLSTQITVCTIALRNAKYFPPTVAQKVGQFFAIKNIYVNSNPVVGNFGVDSSFQWVSSFCFMIQVYLFKGAGHEFFFCHLIFQCLCGCFLVVIVTFVERDQILLQYFADHLGLRNRGFPWSISIVCFLMDFWYSTNYSFWLWLFLLLILFQ